MKSKEYNENKNRVAIYTRVSTLHQIDKDSLPMQRQDLINYTKLILGTEDYVVFEDAGYSGGNTSRPGLIEMFKQIRAGAFTHVLVWKIDRISRNLIDFATMYEELKKLKVTFVSRAEQFDTSTAMGEAMLKIILVFAELERNMTSERVTATMISRAESGKWNGGRVPYGFTRETSGNDDGERHEDKFIIDPVEGKVALLIHNKYEEMQSLLRLSRWLNECGYRTRAGNPWSPVALYKILSSIFYCGDYMYNVTKGGDKPAPKPKDEVVIVKDHHVALVSREQKERIVALLKKNNRSKRVANNDTKNTHIFGGLVYCGVCGSRMWSSTSNQDRKWVYSKYGCPERRKSKKCYGKSTSDITIGEFVFNYILNMLNAQKNFKDISSPEELQKHLLLGDTFSYIKSIEPDGLNDLYNVLSSGVVQEIYSASINMPKKEKVDSVLSNLKQEKQIKERALRRLVDLYLYSEESLPEQEFIVRKEALTNEIEDINEQIGFLNSDGWQQTMSDEDFIKSASEFIITQKLTDRVYISYKRLATSVDPKVLKDFVNSIIDSITVEKTYVKQIVFKNGLAHTFIYNDKI